MTSSAGLQVNVSLAVTVGAAPRADSFHVIGGTLVHGFYDESRQLLFATNPSLNEVDAISGTDFSIRARVPVPQPWGIDQMPDGKTLVIGTLAQQLLTVDEDTLVVTSHPVPDTLTTDGLFYISVTAAANGKVFIIGQKPNTLSNDVINGGQYLMQWDSVTDTFSKIEPSSSSQPAWETDFLARSGDHKWLAFSADQFYLYGSDADVLSSVSLDGTVIKYALNSDGSIIAVALGSGSSGPKVTFFDRSFNVLGTVALPNGSLDGPRLLEFTPDGKKLILQYSLPIEVEVVDAVNYKLLGSYSGLVASGNADSDILDSVLAVDSIGRAFIGSSGGFRVIDMTAPAVPNVVNQSGISIAGENGCNVAGWPALPLNQTVQASLPANAALNTSFYVGGKPASVISNGAQIVLPASSVPGPADLECVFSDGNSYILADAYSYGVVPVGLSANLFPPGGGQASLYGYGLLASKSDTPSVSIGGQPAATSNLTSSLKVGSLQGATIQVPAGTPGTSADLSISSGNGSGTLSKAVTYIPSASVLASAGLLQVVYDNDRNLLYALKATEIDVLNPTTLQWETPIQLPGVGGTAPSYNVMALSPDGAYLVAGSTAGYVTVLNPDHPDTGSVVPVNWDASLPASLVITARNKALLTGSSDLEIDLPTLAVRSISPIHIGDLVRVSSDGNSLYSLEQSFGLVRAINIDDYSEKLGLFMFLTYTAPWTDLAVSPDGTQIAGIMAPPHAAGDRVVFFDSALHLLNMNVYPLLSPPYDWGVVGSTFSPGGKVLIVPLGDSVEFWDVATGTLRARLMTPERLNVLVYPETTPAQQMALDATGQTIFAISASGLTVMKLPQPADDLQSVRWPVTVNQSPTAGAGTRAKYAQSK